MENQENLNLENYEFTPDDFELAQAQEVIHDTKFQTKTTTFAKDAFKRFCKNKSSVVAAILIGILILLAIFVPILSPHDITKPDPNLSLLPPKLFEAGTGFWDGTETYYDISWNAYTESPEGFSKHGVLKFLDVKEGELTNTPHQNAMGGYVRFSAKALSKEPADRYSKVKFFHNYHMFEITAADNYQVALSLGTENGIDGEQLGEWRVVLYDDKTDLGATYGKYLSDWTTNHVADTEDGLFRFNLSEYLSEIGLEKIENGRIRIELVNETVNTYMLINQITLTSESVDAAVGLLLEDISLNDANTQCLMNKQDDGTFPIGYWQSSGNRKLYAAEKKLVSFVYDRYAAVFGTQENYVIGGSEIMQFVENGWCEYDLEIGVESFKVLDYEKCPIINVHDQVYSENFDVYNLTCDISYYKYKGYTEIPSYLFGTTAIGYDLVKLSFNSLGTSLFIAFLASAVCLAIGLVWGSISGYFGGNVDLAMERFCEILSGVPFIVVMTLVILHFGNTIGVFAFGLCITGWLGVAGRTRTQFYRFKGREYILASRTLGSSDMRLIFRHILPNALGTIVTSSVLMIPSVIFSEASLSYLKLGLQGVQSFGVLLSTNQNYLKSDPALILFPASIISILMISFNLFGNGLRDALNPSLKGSE